MRHLASLFLLIMASVLSGQTPTSAAERAKGMDARNQMEASTMIGGLEFTNIGPTVMSGRVTDLAVDPANPSRFYVAYASGGLWLTENNGLSFEPLFQHESVMTIGDIDVHWASGTIYLGSGEVNSSRSSYAGNGIYKSTDWGKTWTHLGLDETHHIGRVLINPGNVNDVTVAALGHLYGDNPERGVYRTTDGGKSWSKTLFVNEMTGAVDMVRNPQRPNELLAATWQRRRSAWDFTEAGPGSGVYKSTDGGATWAPFIKPGSGFPLGEGTGRIGLAIGVGADNQPCYFVSLDNYNRRPEEAADPEVLTKNQLKSMPLEDVLRLKDYLLDGFLRGNGFPRDLDSKSLRKKLEDGSLTTAQMVDYLEDANRQLFDTPVVGLEVYQSSNEGKSWNRTHSDYLDGVYNSYGYYFGQLAVNPNDCQQLYAMGVPIIRSDDGGKTWKSINGDNVHADHHALWINPKNPNHLINGNDGGVNISYDAGEHWLKANTPAVGQFYSVAVDNHPDGYRVYGGLQDNGVWRGPHDYEPSEGWHQYGKYPYQSVMGGDGMQVQVDPRDNETLYTGYQFGNYFRINPKNEERKYITPKHELGQRPYRWNWQAPIHLSIHLPDVVYFGSNHLHRSYNQGDDWATISEDLTMGGKPGDVPFGTLSSIHESPLRFGLLYTGSDDGLIHVSKDGGNSWENCTPETTGLWVSRIQASAHEESRVYLSLNGYRNDNFAPYVYVSENYGTGWRDISANLSHEPVNVIREDPVNENVLYVGTDHGLYISLDRGLSYEVATGMPRVAVHDLAIQVEEKDLVVGTHGRSFYRLDIEGIQSFDPAGTDLMVLAPKSIRYSGRWGSRRWWPRIAVDPKVTMEAFAPRAGTATVTVSLKDGPKVRDFKVAMTKGLNRLSYDLTIEKSRVDELEKALNKDRDESERPVRIEAGDSESFYLRPGTYTLKVELNGQEKVVELVVK
ncbi:glycosyl hydrolase [Lewinellaceae bacterium SD302]|nr:glycosyl hydrolase [Lewinellaceae bacterium SD302]